MCEKESFRLHITDGVKIQHFHPVLTFYAWHSEKFPNKIVIKIYCTCWSRRRNYYAHSFSLLSKLSPTHTTSRSRSLIPPNLDHGFSSFSAGRSLLLVLHWKLVPDSSSAVHSSFRLSICPRWRHRIVGWWCERRRPSERDRMGERLPVCTVQPRNIRNKFMQNYVIYGFIMKVWGNDRRSFRRKSSNSFSAVWWLSGPAVGGVGTPTFLCAYNFRGVGWLSVGSGYDGEQDEGLLWPRCT